MKFFQPLELDIGKFYHKAKHMTHRHELVSHPLIKEMLAGFAAAAVDQLFKAKRLDFLNREKAKHRAILTSALPC